MILILTHKGDQSTFNVADWLLFFKEDFILINDKSILSDIKVKIYPNEILMKIDGKTVNINKVKSFWYRRGGLNYQKKASIFGDISFSNQVNKHLTSEVKTLLDYTNHKLEQVNSLGSKTNSSVNKLISLDIAQQCGLEIPCSIITTKKSDVKKMIDKFPTITKGIQGVAYFNSEILQVQYGNYTEKVKYTDLKAVRSTFFPSLFQENVEKDFELRIFYLKGEFYSMAIFSQNDEQTSTDFRKYNDANPNRVVPYNLPKEIEYKLELFMRKMNLNTGSIDMISTKNNKFVFLEVNPIGQFGMTSSPCNYNLEKKIADFLRNGQK